MLAGATTAALERCFVEHLDCCQYRLDAWETGLVRPAPGSPAPCRFAGSRDGDLSRRFRLGGAGRRPPARSSCAREALPAVRCAPPTSTPCSRKTMRRRARTRAGLQQGGFVHAPSINHASAVGASAQRLSQSRQPDAGRDVLRQSVLGRVCARAEFVLRGHAQRSADRGAARLPVRARAARPHLGQRALDEFPVLELNEFIAALSQAFRSKSREIAQAGEPGPAKRCRRTASSMG